MPGKQTEAAARPEPDSPGSTAVVRSKVQLIILGRELVDKRVTKSGKSGRVYLPLGWVGKTVKVVRID